MPARNEGDMDQSIPQSIRFEAVLRLSARPSLEGFPIHGPLFQGWTPNGEADAIKLPTSGLSNTVNAWFERRFKPATQPLEYSFNHACQVSDAEVAQTSAIDAGYLFASCEIAEIPQAIMDHLLEKKTTFNVGDSTSDNIQLFAKSLYKTFFPPIRRFSERLILECGQWWLESPREWDSRKETLGNYFQDHWVSCRLPNGSRHFFVPTAPTTTPDISIRFVGGYMTKSDWMRLAASATAEQTFSPALRILVDAERCLIEDQQLHALVQAITALEIAISEYTLSCYRANSKASKQMSSWSESREETLGSRLAALFARSATHSHQVESTLHAIALRNRIVHKGFRPADLDELRSLTEATISLCRVLLNAEAFKMCVPGHRVFLDGKKSVWD